MTAHPSELAGGTGHNPYLPEPAAIVTLAIADLVLRGSPRRDGERDEHTRVLAAVGRPLPPILVHRRTMQVLDGFHRVRAARLRGAETIEAVLFDGDTDAAFVQAVRANVAHGLPLSLADRRAAAERILTAYPDWSDRAVSAVAGLSATAIQSIRSRAADGVSQVDTRIGRDGRVRPLTTADGRRHAARLIADQPDVSLREIARTAGISVGTARDVRLRVRNGEDPVPSGRRGNARASTQAPSSGAIHRSRETIPRVAHVGAVSSMLERLRRDPTLRYSEQGRQLIRWLAAHHVGDRDWSPVIGSVPPHCADTVAAIAHAYARAWQDLVEQLQVRRADAPR